MSCQLYYVYLTGKCCPSLVKRPRVGSILAYLVEDMYPTSTTASPDGLPGYTPVMIPFWIGAERHKCHRFQMTLWNCQTLSWAGRHKLTLEHSLLIFVRYKHTIRIYKVCKRKKLHIIIGGSQYAESIQVKEVLVISP